MKIERYFDSWNSLILIELLLNYRQYNRTSIFIDHGGIFKFIHYYEYYSDELNIINNEELIKKNVKLLTECSNALATSYYDPSDKVLHHDSLDFNTKNELNKGRKYYEQNQIHFIIM